MVGKGEIGSDRGHHTSSVSWTDATLRRGWTKNWAMWGNLGTGLQEGGDRYKGLSGPCDLGRRIGLVRRQP